MSELPDWAKALPEQYHEDLGNAPHVKGSDSFSQWVDNQKNDSAWRGQSIRVPGEDADEDMVGTFHQQLMDKVPGLMPTPVDDESTAVVFEQLGKPSEASGYKSPEGVDISNIDEYRAVAHSLDMTQKAFSRWMEMEASGHADSSAAYAAMLDESYTKLKGEWGAAFDDRYSDVGNILREAPENIREAYNNKTLPVEQVKWLHGLVELASEDTVVDGQQGKAVMTPEQAALELEEFKPTFYAMKKHDRAYPAAQAKFERLVRMRMGEVA